MRKKFDKKGDASSIITFVIITFFVVTAMLIAGFANHQIAIAINDTVLNSTQVAQDVLDQMDSIDTHGIQNGAIMIVAFLMIGMMISSFMVRIHPIFLFLYIIFLAIALFISVPLANSYQLLMNADAIASYASQQTYMTWIMEHLLWIVLCVGALSMMITFGKLKDGSTGTQDI